MQKKDKRYLNAKKIYLYTQKKEKIYKKKEVNKLTKREIKKRFKEDMLPAIISIYGKNDKTAIRTGFNDYTDMLCKEGVITQKQYETIIY